MKPLGLRLREGEILSHQTLSDQVYKLESELKRWQEIAVQETGAVNSALKSAREEIITAIYCARTQQLEWVIDNVPLSKRATDCINEQLSRLKAGI